MHAPAQFVPQSVSFPRLGPAVEGLDEALTRGSAAWDVLRGERVGPPVAARRWPWAVGAAVAGAAAGVGVAFLLRRIRTHDAPDAVDPERVEAVVDRTPATKQQA